MTPVAPRPIVAIEPLQSDANPFVARFAQAIAAAGADPVPFDRQLRSLRGYDAVVLHWPALFMGRANLARAAVDFSRLLLARALYGTRLIWVAHNVVQHDNRPLIQLIPRAFVRSLSGIVYLSQRSREMVRQTYPVSPRTRELVTVHGRYDGPGPAFVPPAAAATVRLINFGLIRRYKNIGALVQAAAALPPGEVQVTVTGKRLDPDYAAELAAIATGAVTLDARDEVLAHDELDALIDDAHGVVLPYRDILNSGAAIHALSRGRPVLMPALGSMPELQALVGERWLSLYEDALTPDRLAAFAAHVRTIPAGAAPDLSTLGWDRVERDLADWLPKVLGR